MDGSGGPNPNVSPEDQMLQLARLAVGWDQDFKVLLVTLAVYGVYSTMIAMALWLTFKRPEKALVTGNFLPPMLIAYISITIDIPIQATFVFRQLRTMVIQNHTLPVQERVAMFTQADWFRPLFITGSVAQGLAGETGIVLVIDNMLRVRKHLGVQSSYEKFLAPVLYVATFCAFSSAVPAKVRLSEQKLGRRDVYNSNPFAIAQTVGQSLIIIIALTTALLYWKGVKKSIQNKRASTPGYKVPFSRMLVAVYESGLCYATIQSVHLAMDLSANPGTPRDSALYLANGIFGATGLIIAVMHAPAIVLIRASKRSMAYTLQPKDLSGRRKSGIRTSIDSALGRIQWADGGHGHIMEGRRSHTIETPAIELNALPGDPEKALKKEEIA